MRVSTILTAASASLLLGGLSLSGAQAQSSQSSGSGGSSSNPPSSHSGSYGATEDRSRADNDTDTSGSSGGSNSSLTSQEFVKRAAQSNLAEIKVSQLAESQAKSPEVKQFAQKMIDDHTKANSELAKVAQSKNLNVPDDTDMMHQTSMKMLQSKSGESFDSAYMKQMDKDHQKTIELFQSAASSPKVDRELQALASKLLPKLQEHEHLVTQIEPKTSSRSASSR